jgi:hypothetical protein
MPNFVTNRLKIETAWFEEITNFRLQSNSTIERWTVLHGVTEKIKEEI